MHIYRLPRAAPWPNDFLIHSLEISFFNFIFLHLKIINRKRISNNIVMSSIFLLSPVMSLCIFYQSGQVYADQNIARGGGRKKKKLLWRGKEILLINLTHLSSFFFLSCLPSSLFIWI